MLFLLLTFFLGCQVRAHFFGIKITDVLEKELSRNDLDRPYKQCVFGKLTFNTDNALPNKNGLLQVSWTLHVASVIRLAENPSQFYILDPGISGEPVLRDVWYKDTSTKFDISNGFGYGYRIGKRGKTAKISGQVVCKPDTRTQYDDCFNPRHTQSWNNEHLMNLAEWMQSFLHLYDYFDEIYYFEDTYHILINTLTILTNNNFVLREWDRQTKLGRTQLWDMAPLGDIGLCDTKYYP